jgi:hypothetical protein
MCTVWPLVDGAPAASPSVLPPDPATAAPAAADPAASTPAADDDEPLTPAAAAPAAAAPVDDSIDPYHDIFEAGAGGGMPDSWIIDKFKSAGVEKVRRLAEQSPPPFGPDGQRVHAMAVKWVSEMAAAPPAEAAAEAAEAAAEAAADGANEAEAEAADEPPAAAEEEAEEAAGAAEEAAPADDEETIGARRRKRGAGRVNAAGLARGGPRPRTS